MLKLKKGTKEYDVIGHITFKPDEESSEQTNYTIVIDGVTTTVESTDTKWTVIEVPDPEPVIEEPVVEPISPAPEPVIIEPTPEEIERNTWLEQFALLEKSIRAKRKLEEVELSFSEEEQARFDALVQWVADNRKIEYVEYM